MAFCCKVISVSAFLVIALLGKGACQSLDCPSGITNITAAMGQIAYPGSSSDYGANEIKCWKIQVPDGYDGIGIYYHDFDIEQCDNCECDSLKFAYNDTSGGGGATWVTEEKCGRKTPSYLKFKRFTDGDPNLRYSTNELFVRFSSDNSVNKKGFNFTFIAKSDASDTENFLNASDGETIEFSTRKFGVQNYPADNSEHWCLIVPSGRQVQITFDTFELEQSENCKNAFVEIREAYFDDGPFQDDIEADYGVILAEHLCGSEKPKPIQSTGNMVWVRFESAKNSATTYKGFKASFKGVGQSSEKSSNQCCDCKCDKSAQGRASIIQPMSLLFISALLVITSKNSLF